MPPPDVRSAFDLVVARWRLTQAEIGALLGPACAGRGGVRAGALDGAGLRAAWLIVRVEGGLRDALGAEAASAWVRAPARAYGGATPLAAMAEEAVLIALARLVASPDAVGDGTAAQ